MESVLLHSKNEHSVVIERCRSTSSARESMSLRLRLEKEMTDTEPLAMSLARKYTSTKGLHKWKPFSMTDQELFFHFVGPSPEGCASLRFILSGSNGVKCTACVDRNIFGLYKGTSKRFRVVGDFIEARTLALCRETSSQGKLSPHEIGHVLSNFEWQLGRLEHTASELILLRRRYRAILTPSQISSSTNFQLEVDFSNRTGDVKTCAAFELSDSYPFAPLNVRLDTFQGDTDVEGLRRLLLKNAKPGFGYLSRTCDVITAFMR